MARKVVANITLSLDGRTTGPAGPYDMGWIVPHSITDMARDHLVAITDATTAVLGRSNYEGFGGFWPTVVDDESADERDRQFAEWLNKTEKVVFSHTLEELPWENSRAADREPAEMIRQLREEEGRDIYVLASQSIIRHLLDAGEVDRLSINLAPEVVGGGARLFEDGLQASSWTLTDLATSDSGSVWLIYDRVR
ncbi:dihydrofolate reductase [Mumia flava]|uniref:Dihydrofolate reductase n=1 Tax=Mumia flava TaxID=1348852 RepID=A0A0B2B2Q3_9ACTN|nr:dihydrofolate reductase family protein [Mumia flava]PJJ56109.1 dihydrofolate reductase [Mumia flava]